jgi:hypothetical protein
MPNQVWVLVALALLAALLGRGVYAWWKFRGRRLVTCPENQRPAGVRLDSSHAALSGLLHAPNLQVAECTRWPEKAGCGQECLREIESRPADCLVRNIVLEWYAGKSCCSCGRPFGTIPVAGANPAVQTADRNSVEWSEIPVDRLRDTLATAKPICFACHMAARMVREHPDLITDRSLRT